MSFYVTTAIPYVNAEPHVGFALELVQADVLARHRRLRGYDVRFLTGTDENALKNVQAAEAEGVPVVELVDRNAARFASLRESLELSYDDFVRTSVDPRHRPGVERLWRACAAAGDLYEREYDGFYCTGCEAFLAEGEGCGEHSAPPEPLSERNWFFRLSRYQDALLELLESGRLRIEPEARRNEVLAFVRAGLSDISVSRARERARGWGIPVPEDPSQVIYVWFDALANYVTALAGDLHRRWWIESDERVHVIGKGILRFHAVYWPAILLAAGEQLPTTIAVHDYVTVNGQKVGKSRGNAVDPAALVERYGTDALRWWLLRESPRGSDADFREELLVSRANDELANGLGNLVSRTVALVRQHRPDGLADRAAPTAGEPVLSAVARLGAEVDAALAHFDFRAAVGALVAVVDEANRFASTTRPWELAKAKRDDELDAVLSVLLCTCRQLAHELRPFLPTAAERIAVALQGLDPGAGRLLFPRLRAAESACP